MGRFETGSFVNTWKQIPLRWFVGVSAVFLFLILILGLRPKDFSFSDRVNWITDQTGIRFSKYGIAYTDPFIEWAGTNLPQSNGFSIEIALKPASAKGDGFNFILALYNEKNSEQLVMGQWRSWIILMNGDDYAHKKRTKRITINTAPLPASTQLITVTTGPKGTKVYAGGQLIRSKKNFKLKIPAGAKSRLLLGNSVYNRHSWRGAVHGLAFYRYPLTAPDVALHFNRWSKTRKFSFAKPDKPSLLYFFDENGGARAIDHSGGNHHLKIPSGVPILKREILALTWFEFGFNRSHVTDIFINLLGFFPLGFLLTATLIKSGGAFGKQAVLITVGVCFMTSLTIEIIQAWMPSRSSDLLDLGANTMGALIGAISCRIFSVWVYSKVKPSGPKG